MWKWSVRMLLGVVGLVTALVVHTLWFTPLSANMFYERIFFKFAFANPELLSQLGMLEGLGIRGHNAKLDDRSQAAIDAQFASMRDNLATLHKYDRQAMTAAEQLNYDILDTFLVQETSREQWRYHSYPVNQLKGVQSELPRFMTALHRLQDKTDVEHYISRLGQFKQVFADVVTDLSIRRDKGVVPPQFVIDKVLTEITNFTAVPVEQHMLYTHLVKTMSALTDIDASEQKRLEDEAKQAIADSVYPGYQQLAVALQSLRSVATDDAGVWKLPDGDNYYRFLLKEQTTTDLTAAQIHQLGVAEVRRIQQQMLQLLHAQGLQGDDAVALLKTVVDNPTFLFEDSTSGREQILVGYRKILADADALLSPAFHLRPKAAIEVRRVPEFAEKTAEVAYYGMPAMDGSRPGLLFANLYNIKATPNFVMKTLAVHEGIPGHHFQQAIQQELTGLPTFRNVLPFTGFTEGWALYAERLMAELGFYAHDPYGDIGRLRAELYRATRLVTDTGIHYKRWTRQEAIAYMTANSGLIASEVEAEVDRYIVNPAQACAYKVGQLEILALRDKAKQALGSRFNLSDFHDVVLKNGAMPLSLLAKQVDQYIATQTHASSITAP